MAELYADVSDSDGNHADGSHSDAGDSEGRWLYRFHSPEARSRHGSLRLYSARTDDGLEARGLADEPNGHGIEACGVLVVAANAEPCAGEDELARLIARHQRFGTACEPNLKPSGQTQFSGMALLGPLERAGEIAFARLKPAPLSDLDSVLTHVLRGRAPRGDAHAFAYLAEWLLQIATAHQQRAVPLSALALSCVLIDVQFGLQLLCVEPPAQGAGSQGHSEWFVPPPAAQAAQDPAHDADGHARSSSWLTVQLLRRCQRFFDLPSELLAARRGESDAPSWLTDSVSRLEAACEQPSRAAWPLPSEALSILRERHTKLGLRAQAEAFSDFVRATQTATASYETASRPASGPNERYRLLERLGKSATSSVFRAYDRQIEQHVAIKLLTLDHRTEPVERLLREVRLLRTVYHPHVVRGFELYEERGQLGAVMEYIEGTPLASALRDVSPVNVECEDLLRALSDVADGLESLHRLGIVHRDIKPENILLSEVRGAVLVDLSLAKAQAQERTLTQAGALLGEPRYRAPELARGEKASPASDVYALAMVALEVALSGFSAGLNTGAARELNAPQAALSALPTGSLREALSRALSQAPHARGTARELAQALRHASFSKDLGLRVRADGEGFFLPDASFVDLQRHGVAARLLRCLAAQLSANLGAASREVLIAQAWPDERMAWSAAVNRLRVAIAQLRRMGLKEVLISRDIGYELDASQVRVES